MSNKEVLAVPAVTLVVMACTGLAALLMSQYPDEVWRPVNAEVTRVSVSYTKYHYLTRVALRTPTGVGEATLTDRPANCHVGDIVEAEQAGIAIRKSATTCL